MKHAKNLEQVLLNKENSTIESLLTAFKDDAKIHLKLYIKKLKESGLSNKELEEMLKNAVEGMIENSISKLKVEEKESKSKTSDQDFDDAEKDITKAFLELYKEIKGSMND